MSINWGLLGPPVDIPGAVTAGFQTGRALARQGARDSAFAALAKDPNNTGALSALASVDPQGAAQFEQTQAARAERERASQLRSALSGAYDPATGVIDPVRARTAYAQAGDIEGAMGFDKEQASSRVAQLKTARENIGLMSRLIDDAVDEPSYQRSVAAARELGLDVSKLPPNFDPAYVAGLKQQAEALIGDVDRELMAVAPGTVVIDKTTGRPIYSNPDRPRYYPVPPGGRLELDPSYQGPGAPAQGVQPSGAPVPGTVEDGYRFKGGDPADPANWEAAGGPGSSSPATFP